MDEIKIIFFDFDWTLFDHKTRTFTQSTILALNKLHKQGIKIVINSARTYYALKKLHTFELIPFDGFIVSNGGAAMIDSKTLYADFINKDYSNTFVKFLDSNHFGYNLIGQYDTYIKEENKNLINNFYEVFYEPYPLPIKEYKDESLLAIQIFSEEKDDKTLKAESTKYGLLFNRFAENNVELTPMEFLKSKGINAILNYLNLKPGNAMAFGDDVNDISMFSLVKYGVCLGNGKEVAKKAAYYVTDTIENDGIYKALIKFGLLKS